MVIRPDHQIVADQIPEWSSACAGCSCNCSSCAAPLRAVIELEGIWGSLLSVLDRDCLMPLGSAEKPLWETADSFLAKAYRKNKRGG